MIKKGVYAASLSVINKDYTLNVKSTIAHAESLIRSGLHGVFFFGSTGQSQLISISEKKELIARVANNKLRNQFNRRASYSSNFKSSKNKWTEVEITLDDFEPTWRGYSYSNYPEIDIEKVNSLGIQISDKQEGEFILEIKYIKAIY